MSITIEDVAALRACIPPGQLAAMMDFSEERAFFFEKLAEFRERTRSMPATYAERAIGSEPRAFLHYFCGGYDAWIMERDVEHAQIQASGLARFHGNEPELGYISLPEIFRGGAELDLHFQPMALAELQRSLRSVKSAPAVTPDRKPEPTS